MGARHIPCGPFANESERYATEYLKARLNGSGTPGQWILLTNHASSSGAQWLSDELDMIVIGSTGVHLVEIKHWNAADLRNDQQGAEREADKLNEKARRLAGKLRRTCPFEVGFVAGKLLLTKVENEKFKDGTGRKRVHGIEVFGLSEWKDLLDVDRSPILTDEQVASAGAKPLGGTPLYCAPDVEARISVTPSDDIFALAATLFHVLFDRPPFQFASGTDKKRGINWDGIDRSEWPCVAQFLDVATSPDKSQRFISAKEAIAFLDTAIGGHREPDGRVGSAPDATPVWTDNEVPWLNQLLQSYPGSPKGNAETRGLDSAFARQTYVPTKLDTLLVEDIRNRKVSLVILCGNAGDGKTAFLQNLARTLGLDVGPSARRIWDYTLKDGLRIRANLDGSAAYQGRSANELLNEIFAPFQHGSFPENLVHLVAINDGPLLAWLVLLCQSP